MKTKRIVCLSILMGFVLTAVYAQEVQTPLEQYQQERIPKTAYERFLYATQMLQQSQDTEIIKEAVLDALNYSTSKNEDEKVLQAVDSAIGRLPQEGEVYRETVLSKGKLLTRLGNQSEAAALFQEAIRKNWKNAMLRYSESLIDNSDMAEACLLECYRIAGLEKYVKYRGEEESLEIFLTLLRMTKQFDPNIQVTEEVAGQLNDIKDKPVFVRIANALCISEDGNITEAVKMLEKLNRELSEKKDHREYKHLPLYKASILFKEAKDFPEAENAYLEYINRNQGKNEKIIESALRLARDCQINREDSHKNDEFAGFIIDSEWFQNENVQEELSDSSKAGIYDMKQNGLAWSGDFDGAAVINKYVAETYPDTVAGINCLRNYALYLGYHDGNEAESLRLLNTVLEKTTLDETVASIRVVFAEIAVKHKNYDAALEHLQAALDSIPPRKKGWKSTYRQEIIDHLDRVIRLKAAH